MNTGNSHMEPIHFICNLSPEYECSLTLISKALNSDERLFSNTSDFWKSILLVEIWV